MTKNYPEGHPLHGLHPNQASTLAYEHAERVEGDPAQWGRATIVLAYEYKKHLTTVKQRDEWLTRAIEIAHAHPYSDWEELLEHVSRQGQDREKLAAMGQSLTAESNRVEELKQQVDELKSDKADNNNWCTKFHELGLEMGMCLGDDVDSAMGFARKLRERADAAETEAKRLLALAGESSAVLDKHLSRAEAAEARAEALTQKRNRDRDALNGIIRELKAQAEDLEREKRDRKDVEYQAWVDNGNPREMLDLFGEYRRLGSLSHIKRIITSHAELVDKPDQPKPPSKFDELIAETRRISVALERMARNG